MLDQVAKWLGANEVTIGPRIPSMTSPARNSLIAETAFRLSGTEYDPAHVIGDRGAIESVARRFLARLPRSDFTASPLTYPEWQEVDGLVRNIRSLTDRHGEVKFAPRLPGCGVVDAGECDILADGKLVEVKAVARPFQTSDLRQSLTYAAMLYASGNSPSSICLLNPRSGHLAEADLNLIAAGASGIRGIELLEVIVTAMSDLQVSA
jgi:hypothetical protein